MLSAYKFSNDGSSVTTVSPSDYDSGNTGQGVLIVADASASGAASHSAGSQVNGDCVVQLPSAAGRTEPITVSVTNFLSTWTSGNRPAGANYVFIQPNGSDTIQDTNLTVFSNTINAHWLNTTAGRAAYVTLIPDGVSAWFKM